jgi:hypothetical protein
MNFVGVDLHKKTAVVCVMNQARQVLETRRLACSDPDGIRKWFATLGSFQVVVEATASYEWFVQLVEPLAERGPEAPLAGHDAARHRAASAEGERLRVPPTPARGVGSPHQRNPGEGGLMCRAVRNFNYEWH